MKKVLIVLLSVLCVFAVCFGIKTANVDNAKKVEASTESSQVFKMNTGAAFRLYWSVPNCGICYEGVISNSILEYATPNLMIVPYDYLTAIKNSTNAKAKTLLEYGDYIEALNLASKKYQTINVRIVDMGDGTSLLVGGVKNILEGNVNRKFFGVYFYEYNGDRYYASIQDNIIENNARSMAYVSSSAYNKLSAVKDISFAEDMVVHYMDKAVLNALTRYDSANGTDTLSKVSLDSLSYKSQANENITDFAAEGAGARRGN